MLIVADYFIMFGLFIFACFVCSMWVDLDRQLQHPNSILPSHFDK